MVSFFTSAKQLGLVVVIVIGLTSAACQRTADSRTTGELSTTTPSSDCRTVPHLIGETEICGQPKNMVALGSPALELLLALDMQPVAYGDHFAPHQGSYDAPAQQIPYLGSQVTGTPINVGSAFSPSIEAIVKAQPDLILATEYSEAEYPALSALAPTLILPWFDSDENLRTLAQLVGRPEQAEQLIAKRQQQIKTAREDFSAVVQAYPEVLALGTSNFPNLSLMTESNGFCASLVAELGFQLVYPADTDGTDPAVIPSVSIEILPQLNQAD
ncbi:MAG: ABC transporter substrate-binding protein, partial [Cyanobacteria bacterium P01_A01_bin.114]